MTGSASDLPGGHPPRTAGIGCSILIPARDEEAALPGCLGSIAAATCQLHHPVEVIVAVNRCTDRTEDVALAAGARVVRDDSRNLAAIRNAAARAATGHVVVTIDADSRMSVGMLSKIDELERTGRYIGGGTRVRPQRWSAGIMLTGAVLGLVLAYRRVSGAVLWCRRSDFWAIGGFDENLASGEDLDFAVRLKTFGRTRNQRFATVLSEHAVTSTRKFDDFGDWYLLRNPRLVRQILQGRTQAAADRFYYDVPR